MECFRMYYIVVTLLFVAIGQSEAGDIDYDGKVPQTVFVGDNVTFQWLYTGTEKVIITIFFILEDSFERLVYYAVSLKNSKPQLQPDTIKKYAKTVKWDGDYENNQYYFTLVNVTDFSHRKNFSIQLQLDDTDGSLLDAFTKDLLFISVVPEVELRIDQTNVSVGDRVSIECNIIKQGRPGATITLYHNNTSLESKKGRSLSYRKDVELKDAGSYRCKAKNTVGDDDSEIIKITVHEKSQKNEVPTYCTRNATKCALAGIDVTCVEPKNEDNDCVKDVVEKKADMTLASAYGLVRNEDKLKIIYGEKETGINENFVKYYGLAVVRKGTKFNLNELKGKKSCHTGAGRTVGWNIPIGYLLFTKKMEFKGNVYQSVADYFSESCAPGVSGKTKNKDVIDELCKLCNSTGETKCSSKDSYASYTGAFKCMAEGNLDRVGFVKQTTADEVFAGDTEKKYGDADDYQLLCKDGTKKALKDFMTCNIDKRPAGAVVTNINASQETIQNYEIIFKSVSVAELKKAGIVGSGAESLVATGKSVKDYVGSFGDHYKAANQPDKVVGPGDDAATELC